MRRLIVTILAVVLTLALVLPGAGCAPAEKVVTVGNKNFTEQYIIGEMIKQLLEDRGFTVDFAPDLSTTVMREGMEAGDIDICPEYTGTAWMVHLGQEYEPGVDNNELYELVKEDDEANGFIWLDPIWNNNTYAFASWSEFVEENDVESLSDLAALYRAEDGKISMFTTVEFSTRPDGLPGMQVHYDFEVDEAYIMTGAPGMSVLALEAHECDVGMVFGTDAKIAEHSWHVYMDDQSYFPPYDITPSVRAEVLDKYPEIEDILNELVATFPGGGSSATPAIVAQCQGVWQGLVAKVDIDKMEPEEVARWYLIKNGLIGGKVPVVFADVGWDSVQVHNRIAAFILENGYGYPESEFIPGETIALFTGLCRGDIDVNMECWVENQLEAYNRATAAGEVVDLGSNFPDSWQGWLVPTYMIENGDLPEGISVDNIGDYWELFKDPEDPTKGRFVNSVPGWECTGINSQKLAEYGLDEYYTDFVAGSDAALSGSMVAAYEKGEPWFGYYWAPTWVLGKLDMTPIEEPPYDEEIWETTHACAYPATKVNIVLNANFYDNAPEEIVEFLTKYSSTTAQINRVLAYMQENEASTEEAAIWFLQEYESVWTEWVPSDVATKVKAALP